MELKQEGKNLNGKRSGGAEQGKQGQLGTEAKVGGQRPGRLGELGKGPRREAAGQHFGRNTLGTVALCECSLVWAAALSCQRLSPKLALSSCADRRVVPTCLVSVLKASLFIEMLRNKERKDVDRCAFCLCSMFLLPNNYASLTKEAICLNLA